MGRIFEVRKSKMFARYDRMSKQFTRIGREIAIAVKQGGSDPNTNPLLRRCYQNAKAVNMPKDRVESAIKKAMGKDQENFEEVLYEGYAPYGVALLVETTTNNPTRTVANVRSYFNKFDGSLSTSGSVSFMFRKVGVFKMPITDSIKPDELELELIDFGLQEMGENQDNEFELRCDFADFGLLQKGLEEKLSTVTFSSSFAWIPNNTVSLTEEKGDEVMKLVAKMEEDDDVKEVFHNLQ